MEIRFDGGVRDIFLHCKVPEIYDIRQTVEMLSDTGKSFSRFGDGEFKIMTERNVDHVFQKRNAELSERLVQIISSQCDSVEVGINRIYFYKDGFEHPYIENFIYGRGYGSMILNNGYIGYFKREHYYDSIFSIPYHHYVLPNEFFDDYFESVKNIWKGKRILLVTGDVEMMEYRHSIFDSAKSIELLEISRKNAFGAISKRLPKMKSRDYVVLFACGLAATVLSYDIGLDGRFQAIDIGHLPKEYEFYKNGLKPYSNIDKDFFAS